MITVWQIRAPRPTQVLLTTLDQCFPIAGGREAIAESRPAFAALGCPSNLATHEAVSTGSAEFFC